MMNFIILGLYLIHCFVFLKNTKFWFWYYVCIFSMMYLCGFVTTLNKRELFSLNHPKLENVNTSRTISNPFYNTLLAHPYSFPFANLSIILPTHLFSIIATCHWPTHLFSFSIIWHIPTHLISFSCFPLACFPSWYPVTYPRI